MKYLLVLAVLVVAFGIWRNKRRVAHPKRKDTATARPSTQRLQNMVACAHCDLHLPLSDAVTGNDGLHYCSAEHRQAGAHAAEN